MHRNDKTVKAEQVNKAFATSNQYAIQQLSQAYHQAINSGTVSSLNPFINPLHPLSFNQALTNSFSQPAFNQNTSFNGSINPSINQSLNPNLSFNGSINQSLNQSVNPSFNQSFNPSINQSINPPLTQSFNQQRLPPVNSAALNQYIAQDPNAITNFNNPFLHQTPPRQQQQHAQTFSQSFNPSFNQSVPQPTNQNGQLYNPHLSQQLALHDQLINQQLNQQLSQSINQSVNQTIDQSVNQSINQPIPFYGRDDLLSNVPNLASDASSLTASGASTPHYLQSATALLQQAIQRVSMSTTSAYNSPSQSSNAASTANVSPAHRNSQTLVVESDQDIFPARLSLSRVRKACSNCKAAKTKCDSTRPCKRCVRTSREITCTDSVHKKRGRKRGNRSRLNNNSLPYDAHDGAHDDDYDHDDVFMNDTPPISFEPEVDVKRYRVEDERTRMIIFMSSCATIFTTHIHRWALHYQTELGMNQTLNDCLSRSLQWFVSIGRADCVTKLMYTGRDGVTENNSTVALDVLIDPIVCSRAFDMAEQQVLSEHSPAYMVPLYPIPYLFSPTSFDPSRQHPNAPLTHPPMFNARFQALLGWTHDDLMVGFGQLSSFLGLVRHPHLDYAIQTFVDTLCQAQQTMSLQAHYLDRAHRQVECVENVTIHTDRGVPIALVVVLHNIAYEEDRLNEQVNE